MKKLKRTGLGILAFLILSSIGGYIYFDIKFTPVKNYLHLSATDTSEPITWVSNNISPISALLLKIRIEGIPKVFYMQFDLGSPNTIFYKNSLESLKSNYPDKIADIDTLSSTVNQTFSLGNIQVSSEKFKIINYGKEIEWNNSKSINIIGTIGADLIDKKITVFDFKKNICSFKENLTEVEKNHEYFDFEFKKRKVFLPVKIDSKNYKLLFDTGTSAFELIVSKSDWEKLSLKDSTIKKNEANSVGKTLATFTKASNKTVRFGSIQIKLNEITYIEGTSFIQNTLMKLSGIGGMIGNKIFINKILILDCKNEKYTIF